MTEEKLLILDFDGVLNGHEWCHLHSGPRIMPYRANILNSFFIRCRKEVRVMVVSTWGKWIHDGSMNAKGFQRMMQSHGIDCEVKGALPCFSNADDRRQVILDSGLLDSHCCAILDDLPLNLPNLIRTNPAIGIEPYHVSELLKIFGYL